MADPLEAWLDFRLLARTGRWAMIVTAIAALGLWAMKRVRQFVLELRHLTRRLQNDDADCRGRMGRQLRMPGAVARRIVPHPIQEEQPIELLGAAGPTSSRSRPWFRIERHTARGK